MGLFWSEKEVSGELMTEDYKIWEKVDWDWLLCVTSCRRIKGNIIKLFENRLKTLKKGVIIHAISSKCKEVLCRKTKWIQEIYTCSWVDWKSFRRKIHCGLLNSQMTINKGNPLSWTCFKAVRASEGSLACPILILPVLTLATVEERVMG